MNRNVDQLIEQAIKEARAGRREAARQRLLNALKIEPNNARAARLLAKLNVASSDDKADAHDATGSPRRLLLLALLGILLLLLPLAGITLLLTTANRDDGAMPTELVLATATAALEVTPMEPRALVLSMPDAAQPPTDAPSMPTETATAAPTEVQLVMVTAEPTMPLPTNTPPQFNVVFPTSTQAQIALPTNLPLMLPTSDQPFFAGFVTPLPTNTPITFSLPTFAPPTSTSTRPAATPTPTDEPFDPLPTSTLMPEFVFGTDVPTPDLRTPIPPTLENFEVDPSGGGGGMTPGF
ncbi:MAG: hypothetical protein SNJ54_08690 [Anaerolineae bacterium]